jgi:hypothetical protein
MSIILCRMATSQAFHNTERSSKQFLSFDSEEQSLPGFPEMQFLSH